MDDDITMVEALSGDRNPVDDRELPSKPELMLELELISDTPEGSMPTPASECAPEGKGAAEPGSMKGNCNEEEPTTTSAESCPMPRRWPSPALRRIVRRMERARARGKHNEDSIRSIMRAIERARDLSAGRFVAVADETRLVEGVVRFSEQGSGDGSSQEVAEGVVSSDGSDVIACSAMEKGPSGVQ